MAALYLANVSGALNPKGAPAGKARLSALRGSVLRPCSAAGPWLPPPPAPAPPPPAPPAPAPYPLPPSPLLLLPARAVWPSGWLVNIQHAALSECYQRKHLRTKKQTEIILHLLSLCHLRCPNLHPGVLLEERVLSGLWLVALGPSFSNRTERKKNNRRRQSFPGTRRLGTDAVAHGLRRNT